MPYEFIYQRESCWYRGKCPKYPEECSAGCQRYMQMHFLTGNSGIPIRRQMPGQLSLKPEKIDRDAFEILRDIKNDIVEFVDDGDSLYICSSATGNGKSSWAIKLMLRYFEEIWAGNGFRVRGLFVHVPTFLTNIKNNIRDRDPDFEEMRKRIPTVDLVIWDDIAATKLSDFDYSQLLTYVDQRTLALLSNIYTGNIITEKGIVDALGGRLASRVWNDSTRVQFLGGDRRGMQ